MFTIFDSFKMLGALAGAVFGWNVGFSFGWLVAGVGGIVGIAIGMIIGSMPWIVCWTWVRYDLKRSSNAKLKDRLNSEYMISHVLISELVERGEPLGQFREYVEELLHSQDILKQKCGVQTAGVWFPEMMANELLPTHSFGPAENARND